MDPALIAPTAELERYFAFTEGDHLLIGHTLYEWFCVTPNGHFFEPIANDAIVARFISHVEMKRMLMNNRAPVVFLQVASIPPERTDSWICNAALLPACVAQPDSYDNRGL